MICAVNDKNGIRPFFLLDSKLAEKVPALKSHQVPGLCLGHRPICEPVTVTWVAWTDPEVEPHSKVTEVESDQHLKPHT